MLSQKLNFQATRKDNHLFSLSSFRLSFLYYVSEKKSASPVFNFNQKKSPQFSYFLCIPLSFRANSISNCITVPKNIFFIVWQKVYPDVICQLVLPIFTIQINFHAQFIIEVQDMLQLPPDEEIAKKYTQFALKYAKYREIKEFTFSQLLEQIATMSLTSIIAHQTMYLLTPTHKQTSFLDFIKHTSFNIQAIRRPTQHTITVFSLKIIIDFFNKKSLLPYDEYKIGAAVGLCSYFLGRPIDQLDTARRQIFANEKKHISRLEAINVVVRHDGFKGFYKHENLLGPICNTMYRAVYFGLWARLLNQYGKKNRLVEYIAIPFVASLGASLSTAIPDKLRSFCLQINDAKSKTLQKRNKKLAIEIPPTFKLMFEHLISPHFKFTKTDLTAISMAVVRNWIILGCFAYGQDYLQKYQKTQKQSKKQ